MKKKHKCWGGLDGVYKWIPRTENPKSCPRCKERLDFKYKKVAQSSATMSNKVKT